MKNNCQYLENYLISGSRENSIFFYKLMQGLVKRAGKLIEIYQNKNFINTRRLLILYNIHSLHIPNEAVLAFPFCQSL